MEDVKLFRMLHRRGRMRAIDQHLIANARRYEEVGRVRLTLAYGLIATLYAFGVPLRTLSLLYGTWCCRHK